MAAKDNPLPYIIVFAILFLVMLGVLTWALGVWYKESQCVLDPNIWCSDNWTCNTSCGTGYSGNACFVNVGSTGLASCIFGPGATGATVCLTTPSGTGGVACDCPDPMEAQTNNCFSGCGINFSDMNPNTRCCCQPAPPGQPPNGCPNTGGIPSYCGGTS